MMKFHIITIFPEALKSYTSESLLGKAREANLLEVNFYNLRDYTEDKHQSVDDKPYGGGPGMVLMVEPIFKAVESIKKKAKGRVKTILFSTRGSKFNEKKAKSFSEYDEIIMICGRYEGVDERVAENIADEEISIGDYILSGGELPALVVTEAVSRFIPGVLGKEESLEEIKGSYPVYTRPDIFKIEEEEWRVPDVLLSGNHKEIEKWRKSNK
jgi:tRNA (guanine37-N1)-methyltransferase